MNEVRSYIDKKISVILEQLPTLFKYEFISILFPEGNWKPDWFKAFRRFKSYSIEFQTARPNLGPVERCDSHKELAQLRYLLEEVGMTMQKIFACNSKILQKRFFNSDAVVLFHPDQITESGEAPVIDQATQLIHEVLYTHLKDRMNMCCDIELPWANSTQNQNCTPPSQTNPAKQNGATTQNGTPQGHSHARWRSESGTSNHNGTPQGHSHARGRSESRICTQNGIPQGQPHGRWRSESGIPNHNGTPQGQFHARWRSESGTSNHNGTPQGHSHARGRSEGRICTQNGIPQGQPHGRWRSESGIPNHNGTPQGQSHGHWRSESRTSTQNGTPQGQSHGHWRNRSESDTSNQNGTPSSAKYIPPTLRK
ncbi:hypothetical protein SMACR_06006 [Sordaria macrospora]|uniref:Uncharacterized protein n=1 Tax=Sordaria macrospora TaxID=5147 RepID=A0A8S8ZGW0_SORMA|nr:hypothetical protein SMACR_06006 [Sordaria macrospora]WPJ57721.1 hypothetical protein SMAC4_06006 [Sordaria macrospora]